MEQKKISKDFVAAVKKLAKESPSLTQGAIAAQIGMDVTTMSNVVAGRRNVQYEFYKSLQEVFNLKIEESEILIPDSLKFISENSIKTLAVVNAHSRILEKMYVRVMTVDPFDAEGILETVYEQERQKLKDQLKQGSA